MQQLSPFARVGARLIERGLCAVPAVPGTKVPGLVVAGRWLRMSDWTRRYADRLPTEREVDTWQAAGGDAGVCLILGRASGGVVAIDVDVEDAVRPVTAALPYTPARKRGAKGETLFFRGSVPAKAFSRTLPDGRRERMVDVLGEGRQTVLPPSNHPDTGRPYRWCGETALEDMDPRELPELPEDALDLIAAALEPLGYRNEVERKPFTGRAAPEGDKTPFRLLNEHALLNLDAWVPLLPLQRCKRTQDGFAAVADWRSSNTGRPIDRRKPNLSITSKGIVDFGDGPKGYTALDLVVACGRAQSCDDAFPWLAEVTKWGADVVHDPKPRVRAEAVSRQDLEVASSSKVIDELKADVGIPISTTAPDTPPWRPEPDDPAKCPGLVGAIADWIVETSDYQQPLLAIGAALAIVGTVAGRQLGGPTRSGTHLYVIGVAPTGSGKDHPLRSISELLVAAKLSHLVGPGKFTSESSITNTVIRSPACACGVDEFGAFLAKGRARTASTHEQGISSTLRTLWGSSFKAVPTTERAGERFKLLHSPAMTIFGTSTAEEFYEALGDADTRNGLLNRFLILENPKRPPRIKPAIDNVDPPAVIVEALQAIYWRLGDLGSAPYHGAGDVPSPAPQIVPWRDEFAELAYDDLQDDIRARMEAEPEHERFLVRTAEMAVRMATVRSIGIDPRDPRVTVEDMNWGASLALASANAMIEGARDRIAEGYWSQCVNKVVNYAKKKLQFRVRDVQQSTKLRGKEIKEILADLIEMGRIQMVDITDARSDTKKTFAYKFIE